MHDFKLLALRPRKGCNSDFLKNLEEDRIYQFYNDYTFLYSEDGTGMYTQEVASVYFDQKVPHGFYDLVTSDGHPLAINISAVVGKNGSGKSTLMDLLLVGIYLFSIDKKILPDRPSVIEHEYERLRKKTELYHREDDETIMRRIRNQIFLDFQNTGIVDVNAITKMAWDFRNTAESAELKNQEDRNRMVGLRESAFEVSELIRTVKCDLFYQLSGRIFRLSIGVGYDGKCMINPIKSNLPLNQLSALPQNINNLELKQLLSDHFFYTIGINYSQFGLNANIIGQWINALFHKNDGYKTPVVINPMRSEGKFDINHEFELAKYRLLSNVLINARFVKGKDKNVPVTEKQSVNRIIFTLNKEKIRKQKSGMDGRLISNQNGIPAILVDLYGVFFPGMEIVHVMQSKSPYQKILENYIIQKVITISERYDGFKGGYKLDRKAGDDGNKIFLDRLSKEGSHIIFKLKQALNFLAKTQGLIPGDTFYPTEDPEGDEILNFDLTLKSLHDFIGEQSSFDLITLLPPSIFSVEIILVENNSKQSNFETLSSGEQQLIHAVQSVLYHIRNIQSVHYSAVERAKYQAINIVFDEIELYFHPDFQRKFISGFLKALENMYFGNRTGINSINILFLTHSPFILSDIPANNILRLGTETEKVDQIESRTFAANIHDLLGNKFFLSDSLMGEFAEKKIEELIERISSGQKHEDDDLMIAMVGDSFLRAGLEKFNSEN